MSPYCLNPFSGPQCTPPILVWPICLSSFILYHLCIFQLRGAFSDPFDAHVPPITGPWHLHTQFPLMLPSSASFPLTTTPSNLSSSATSSGSCPRPPCSVTFCLGLLGHCQAPLVSAWGQQQGSGGFGWGLAGYYVPRVHSVQASCIILGSCRLPKSCFSKTPCLGGDGESVLRSVKEEEEEHRVSTRNQVMSS